MTTEANRQLSAIQDRMPVIIEREDWPLWLGEAEGDPHALLRPLAENVLRVWPVGKEAARSVMTGRSCWSCRRRKKSLPCCGRIDRSICMRRRYRNELGSVGLAAIALLTVAGWLWLKNFPQPPASPQ
jgi:hypothetical protein